MNAVAVLAAALDDRDANYDRLLRLVDDMASGKIVPGRVAVDLQARTWAVTEPSANRKLSPTLSSNGTAPGPSPLRVEGGIEGLRRLVEEEAEPGA